MRAFASLKVIAASVLLLLTGGPTVLAQSESIMDFLRRDQDRIRQQRLSTKPAILRPPRNALERRAARRPRPAQEVVVVRDTPEATKIAPTAFVAMLGDSLGELVAQGLLAELADRPEIAVQKKARGSSGLVRDDFHDWPKAVAEMLAAADRPTVAVMMLGTNDRQPIREGGVSHDPASERWREIYRERVAGIVRAFADKRVPLVWVGLPPMQAPRYSAEMLALNEIYRAEVEKAGGHWVEIWEAFADAQGRFTSHGPDVNGQPARLRTSDGIHLTRAGAQKVAHFVDVALKRLIERPASAPVIAVPADPAAAVPPPALPDPPEPAAAPVTPPRPLAGPILPLTRADGAPGGVLLTEAPARRTLVEDASERVLVLGRPAEPKPGRADDHRWTPR